MSCPFPQPITEELLSAYLCRCAQRYGMRPTIFGREVDRRLRIWQMDCDVVAPPWLVDACAHHLDLHEKQVERMTLGPWLPAMSLARSSHAYPEWIARFSPRPGRQRQVPGLVFCPLCLAASGTFVRQNRLSWMIWCAEHQVPLQDACLACHAPVLVHRQQYSLLMCWRCGSRLTARSAVSSLPTEQGRELQASCLSVLAEAASGKGEDSSLLHFAGMTYVQRLLRQESLRHVWEQQVLPRNREVLGGLRLVDRKSHLEVLAFYRQGGFQPLLDALLRAGVTQRFVRRIAVQPSHLDAMIAQLPAGQIRCVPQQNRIFRARLQRLRRLRPPGWRTAHARMLVGTRAHVRQLARQSTSHRMHDKGRMMTGVP